MRKIADRYPNLISRLLAFSLVALFSLLPLMAGSAASSSGSGMFALGSGSGEFTLREAESAETAPKEIPQALLDRLAQKDITPELLDELTEYIDILPDEYLLLLMEYGRSGGVPSAGGVTDISASTLEELQAALRGIDGSVTVRLQNDISGNVTVSSGGGSGPVALNLIGEGGSTLYGEIRVGDFGGRKLSMNFTGITVDGGSPEGAPSETARRGIVVSMNGSSKSDLEINGVIVQNCSAPDNGNGGGILLEGRGLGNTVIRDSSIRQCQARSGGGVYSSGALAMYGCEIGGNTALSNGGGVYSGGALVIGDTAVTGNRASLGGGLYLSQSGAAVNDSGFIDNYGGRGGAIHLPTPFDFKNLTMNTVTFGGNTAGSSSKILDVINQSQLEMFARTLQNITFDRDRENPQPAGREDVSALAVNNIDISYSRSDYEPQILITFFADVPGGRGEMLSSGGNPEDSAYVDDSGTYKRFGLFAGENFLERYSSEYETMTASQLRKDYHRWDGGWYLDPERTQPVDIETHLFEGSTALYPGWIDATGETVTVTYVDENGDPIPDMRPEGAVVGDPYGDIATNHLSGIERAFGWESPDGGVISASDPVKLASDHSLILRRYPQDVSYELRLPQGGRYAWADGYDGSSRTVFLDHDILPAGREDLYVADTLTGKLNIGWHDGNDGYFVMGRTMVTFGQEALYPVFDEVKVSFETFAGENFPDQYYPILYDNEDYPSYQYGPGFPDASELAREGHWLENYGDGPAWYIRLEDGLAVRHNGGSWIGLYPDNEDHTLYLNWISDQYNIAFITDDGIWDDGARSAKILSASHGSKLPEPGELRRDGAEFIGWRDSDGNRRYPGADEATASLTLYPVWAYRIIFHPQGGLWENGSGEAYSPVPVKWGTPLPDPGELRQPDQGLGCTVWKNADGVKYIPGETPVTETLDLFPVWETAIHTVTFDPDGGKWKDETYSPAQEAVPHGNTLPDPGTVASGDKLHDGGWQDQYGNIFIPGETPVTGNITLKPLWKYTVTLHLNGGTWDYYSEDPRKLYLLPGKRITLPEFSDKIGGSITGWYLDGALEWDFNEEVYGNLKLIAQWEAAPAGEYKVLLNPAGGVWTTLGHSNPHTVTTAEGAQISIPPLERKGYRLTGWMAENGQLLASGRSADSGAALTAQWDKLIAVNFETAGGSEVEPVFVQTSHAYGRLPIPMRTGYSFDGWYTSETGGDAVEDSSLVAASADHTLYARWKPHKLLVEFNWMDKPNPMATNHTIRNAVAEYGDLFGSLETAAPVHSDSGLNFQGWFTEPSGGSAVKAGDIITDGVMVYAHWTPGQNQVTFEVDGAVYLTLSRDTGLTLTEPEPPETQIGRVFAGWYLDEHKWNFHDEVTADITLVARFTGETPPAGRLGITGNPRVELPVNDRRPYADRSVSWDELFPLLGLVVTDDTGANVTERAEITPVNYHYISFDAVGEYILHYTAAADGKSVNGTTAIVIADRSSPVITPRRDRIEISAGRRPSLGYLMAKAGVSAYDNYDDEVTVIPSFHSWDYKSIPWNRPGEYIMLLDAADSAGNLASCRRVVISVVQDGDSDDGQGFIDRGDDTWTPVDDSGNPLGLFHKTTKGDWVYAPDGSAPPVTLPNTGSKAGLPVIAAIVFLAASVVLRRRGREKEY